MRALVFAALLGLAVLAWRATDRGPRVERPEVEPALDGMVVHLRVTPPGPAALEVASAGLEPRRMISDRPLADHAFALEKLPRGAWIEAQGIAGGRRGPPLAFAYKPLGPEDVRVDEGPRGLVVRLRVAKPLACTLFVNTRGGVRRIGSDAPALEHEIALDDAVMPFKTDMHVRLTGGAQVVEERLPWDDAARRAYLLCAAAWLCGQAETLVPTAFTGGAAAPASIFDQIQNGVNDITTGRSATARAGVDARLEALAEALPPEWFLEELGGAGGVLDRTDLPRTLRERFDAALHQLEVLDAALVVRSLRVRYPYHRLYGAQVGPALTSHLGTARSVALLTEGQDTAHVYLLTPDNAVARQTLRFDIGHPKTFLARAVARLGVARPGRRAELQATLELREGTFVDVAVNGRPAARFCRPGKSTPHTGAVTYYVGFDAALLREGDNVFEMRCRGMPPVIENLEFDHGVVVHPPGFTLRLKG